MSDVDSRRDITNDRSTHGQPRAFGAPLWWVEQLPIVFANEHAAEDQAYLRRCTRALFPQGAFPAAWPVGALAVGLAARCLAQKRHKLCAGVPSSAVSNSLGLKGRAVDHDEIYETAIN